MKKLTLEKFSGEIVKGESAKLIVGGYGDEGNTSSTSTCTNTLTGTFPTDSLGDTHSDGDWYPSC